MPEYKSWDELIDNAGKGIIIGMDANTRDIHIGLHTTISSMAPYHPVNFEAILKLFVGPLKLYEQPQEPSKSETYKKGNSEKRTEKFKIATGSSCTMLNQGNLDKIVSNLR